MSATDGNDIAHNKVVINLDYFGSPKGRFVIYGKSHAERIRDEIIAQIGLPLSAPANKADVDVSEAFVAAAEIERLQATVLALTTAVRLILQSFNEGYAQGRHLLAAAHDALTPNREHI